jgi:uncharacterized membrane protein
VWRLRKPLGWVFAIECFFFAILVWILHYPPERGRPFIRGGDASPTLTVVEVSAFYCVVISVLGVAWWTIWKEMTSCRIWGIAGSIVSLFVYVDPSYWYKIQRPGVWVHWTVCALGLLAFLIPESGHSAAPSRLDQTDEQLPNAVICYSWGILFPIAYLLTRRKEDQNTFLRFHCIQCLILFLLGALCYCLQGKGWRGEISAIGFLALVVSYMVVSYNARQRRRFRLPLISAIAERFV